MSATAERIDYLNPDVPATLPWHELALVEATPDALRGFGMLVDDPRDFPIEIVTWPKPDGRPVDPGTGNEAGTTCGEFSVWWQGDVLFGANTAVNDRYLFGWARNPGEASRDRAAYLPPRVLLWHANYHPDGGQLFFPRHGTEFVTPLALPGDDVTPDSFVAFHVTGGKGLYIHPGIWHEGVFPVGLKSRFYDEQGRVHARVSVNFAKEFGVFLNVPLPQATAKR